MSTSHEDPWAEHVAAIDESKTKIAELVEMVTDLTGELQAVREAPHATEREIDSAEHDLVQATEALEGERRRLHSLEQAYATHQAYQANAATVTISAEQQPDAADEE